jgi:hypothetical protein
MFLVDPKVFRYVVKEVKESTHISNLDDIWQCWIFAVLWRPFWKWRPVEIFQCRESIRDIQTILVLDWSISKNLLLWNYNAKMNRNLVGSTYGRFCIKFPQNEFKNQPIRNKNCLMAMFVNGSKRNEHFP